MKSLKRMNNLKDKKDIIEFINKYPQKFKILCVKGGFFGSLVYRIIVGSDNKFVWKPEFASPVAKEVLKPLEWPVKTEGFAIYDLDNIEKAYNCFKEQQLASVHIGVKLLEALEDCESLAKLNEKNKLLLLKTHDLDCHKILNCEIIRVYGSLNIFHNPAETTLRQSNSRYFDPIYQDNVYNLEVCNLVSDNFEIFLYEYLKLCNHLDINININNVRAFILLLLERIKRFQLTLS